LEDVSVSDEEIRRSLAHLPQLDLEEAG